MPEPIHKNYTIDSSSEKIVIDYKRTPKEWFYFIFNTLLGSVLILFPAYLFYSGKNFEWNTKTIIGTVFLSLIMLWGFLRLVLAGEILALPTRSLIIIDKIKNTITVKLIFLRSVAYTFDEINEIHLSGHDTTAKDHHEGTSYKKRLYLHQLNFLLKDGKLKKIHRFTFRNIFIPVQPKKETFEVSSISKHIAKLIASETGIKYKWLGTKKQQPG